MKHKPLIAIMEEIGYEFSHKKTGKVEILTFNKKDQNINIYLNYVDNPQTNVNTFSFTIDIPEGDLGKVITLSNAYFLSWLIANVTQPEEGVFIYTIIFNYPLVKSSIISESLVQTVNYLEKFFQEIGSL